MLTDPTEVIMRIWNRYRSPAFSDPTYGQQTVVRRSAALWAIPVTLLALLILNLIWEILRRIAAALQVNHWLWRLQLLDAPPTIALIAVTSSIIILGINLTHTSRPSIGFGDNPAYGAAGDIASLRPAAGARVMHFHNTGPGVAIVESIDYALMLGENSLDLPRRWLSEYEFRNALSDNSFVEGPEFVLFSTGRGAPLQVAKGWKEGFLYLAITEDAVLRVAGIDVRLRVRDGVGNVHERVLRVAQSHNRESGERDAVYKEQARLRRKLRRGRWWRRQS